MSTRITPYSPFHPFQKVWYSPPRCEFPGISSILKIISGSFLKPSGAGFAAVFCHGTLIFSLVSLDSFTKHLLGTRHYSSAVDIAVNNDLSSWSLHSGGENPIKNQPMYNKVSGGDLCYREIKDKLKDRGLWIVRAGVDGLVFDEIK